MYFRGQEIFPPGRSVIVCRSRSTASGWHLFQRPALPTRRTHKSALLLLVILLGGGSSAAAFAGYEEGLQAALAGDYQTAFREFSAAAESGLDMAQYNLGILYFMGRGTGQDLEQAYFWTRKAAEQGHIQAQFNLAALYAEGQGVERNPEEAFHWYRSAALGGHGEARYTVATLYQQGKGTSRDLPKAHAWARFAVESEVEDSEKLLRDIEKSLSPTQLSEARRSYARIQIGLE